MTHRIRADIEADIDRARRAVNDAESDIADAEADLGEAQDWLAELDAELAALPPEGVSAPEAERWHAQHDPRQIGLFGE